MGETPDHWRSAHFYHYFGQFEVPSHYGIRTNDYKLINFYEAESEPKWELYDMKNDPQEMINLIRKPDYEQVIKNLKILLHEKRDQLE